MDALLKFWPVIGTVIGLAANVGLTWICWSMRQWTRNEVEQLIAAAVVRLEKADSENATAGDELESRVTKVEGKVSGISTEIAKLPTKADIARLEGEIKVVAGAVGTAAAGIARLEDYFLDRGTRG